MKRLMANKKLMTIIAISLVASLTIPYVLATTTSAPIPTIPSQCMGAIATGWLTSPIINARVTVRNYEDSGLVGYWALDNFVESFVIWQNNDTTPNTFCALDQYSGTWKTFAGALSPQNGVEEPSGASGSMNAAIIKIFTGTFLGPYCKVTKTNTCSETHSTKPTTGSIGTFNLGGTEAQILLGTYAEQKAFNPPSFLTFYFKNPSITSEPVWSWIYAHGNGAGFGNMWVNDLTGSFGDIV